MTSVEAPLRCLAVHVGLAPTGEIDHVELEACLDDSIGRGQWLSSTDWTFADPSPELSFWPTVAVIVHETIAALAIKADASNDPPRILHDYALSPAEEQNWLAAQAAPNFESNGRFQWGRVYA